MLYDDPLSELADAADADELCRLLLESAWGWGLSTDHREAVELLRSMRGTGELGDGLLALLLCTCGRWHRVTAKLIAAIEESALLTGAEADALAEAFLADEVLVECPVDWLRPDLVDLEFGDDVVITVADDLPVVERRHPEPPLRRWAATRTLRADPGRLDELLEIARRLSPAHRDAVLHGLLDAASDLEAPEQRRLVTRGLQAGTAAARRRALDVLCDLDSPDAARRRARRDRNEQVRNWRPPAVDTLFASPRA